MGKPIQIKTGDRFGRLTVIEEASRYRTSLGGTKRRFLCLCDCGAARTAFLHSLRSGHTRSCGCFQRDQATKHGLPITPTYEAWVSMRARCSNTRGKSYHYYGGRGIAVCQRWLDSYEAFLEDMGPRPEGGYSLHRVDNDGDYEPGNCVWATWKQQARNTRRNTLITHNSETKCLSEWAEDCGINRITLSYRLRSGWSVADALTRPVRRSAQ